MKCYTSLGSKIEVQLHITQHNVLCSSVKFSYSYSVHCDIPGRRTKEIHIKGYARGGIAIHCKFHNHKSQHQKQDTRRKTEKYFCKDHSPVCKYNYLQDRRIKQYEDVLWGFLTVIIFNLTSNDNGTYHCVEEGTVHTRVHLHVVEGKT